MEIKRIWMSQNTKGQSRYGLRTLGGVLGIAALVVALAGGGTALALFAGWPIREVSLLLCVGAAVLALALAVGLGRRSVRDATVFFLTEGDHLFLVNVSRLVSCGGSTISQIQGLLQTQQRLRELARSPRLPSGADEILRVEQIRENPSHYVLLCQIRRPNREIVRSTCLLVKGLEEEELLLRQLERRQGWPGSPEIRENKTPFYLLLSILAFCGFAALCALSHPAVGRLPGGIYFPCLAAAFAAASCAAWLFVRHRRGE